MRSTNAETANPLLTQKQTTGSPFGTVLASTAEQSSPVADATTGAMLKGSAAQAPINHVAEAAESGPSQDAGARVAAGDHATNKVAPTAQSTTSASPTNNANGSVRVASREDKALATTDVAAVNAGPLPEKTILPQQPIAATLPQVAMSVQPAGSAEQPVAPLVQTIDPAVPPKAPVVRAAAPMASATPPVVQAAPPGMQPAASSAQPIALAVQSMNPAVQPMAEQPSGQQNERSAGDAASAVTVQPAAAHDSGPAPPMASLPAAEHAAGPRPNETSNPGETATAQNSAAADPATASTTNDDGSVQPSLTAVSVLPSYITLPDASLPGNDVLQTGAGPLAGKGQQSPGPNATISKVSDGAGVVGTGKTSGADSSTAASGTHGVQSSTAATASQASQTAQPAANGAQIATKSADNGAQAIQAIGTAIGNQAAVHDARRAGDGVSDGPHSTELTAATVSVPRENGESTQTSAISTARLIQTMNETGMQVGMRSAEFGDISIRTSVSQQQMLAQISVDHGDLGKAIAMHVPAVQSKLGEEFGLRASIEVHQSGASFSGEQVSSSAGQQRPYARSVQPQNISPETESLNPVAVAAAWDGNRLDVRA